MTPNAQKFLAQNPTLLLSIGRFKLYEHPVYGDEAPIFMVTPDGRLKNTGRYDIEEFDLLVCEEIAA